MRNLKTVFDLCRKLGIAAEILPRNFPRMVILRAVNCPGADWAGYGGMDKNSQPFVTVNMAHTHSLTDLIATMAHEMLHIQQARSETSVNHGNKFRQDCAKFAKILGLTYYHLNGYDKPSVEIVKAQNAAKLQHIRQYHKDKKAGKIKPIPQEM